ncbi:MAG: hypothetical protein LBG42_01870 [Treponema sp.]|nr:hypothetical protein [Treponema sp.]
MEDSLCDEFYLDRFQKGGIRERPAERGPGRIAGFLHPGADPCFGDELPAGVKAVQKRVTGGETVCKAATLRLLGKRP